MGNITQTPLVIPLRGPFSPRFILQRETAQYGLPAGDKNPGILWFIDLASQLIDSHCGRTDGWGQGSLVYSTYMERIPMQAAGRNVVRVAFKPMIGVDASTVNMLQASANLPINEDLNPLLGTNWYWTGVQASTISNPQIPGNTLSPVLGCSGRYGYTRRNAFGNYPDLNYGINPLMIASFFGGPPGFTPINVANIDVVGDVGELWVPAGLYLAQYTEIVVVYNSGFHPLYLPSPLKKATAMVVKNMLSRGGGVTALRSLNVSGTANVNFGPEVIDENVDNLLDPFKTLIAF
jgi:hypothetical protein